MARPLGSATSAPPVANVVLCSAVVVSCRKEGAERLTAGGVFRQDPCRVWNHDACQLCKAGLSPRISLKKEKLKKKMECLSTMCELSIICTCLGFQRRFDFGTPLKTDEEHVYKTNPTARKHVLVFVLKKFSQHSMQRRSCIVDIKVAKTIKVEIPFDRHWSVSSVA